MQLEKGDERTSNWELKLEKQQIDCKYCMLIAVTEFDHFFFSDAANDVHSAMVVYQKLCNIAQLNAITLADKKPIFTSNVKWPTSEKYQ